ncbi:RNA-binding protein P-like [Panicum virgatum]|uniref:RRM domain-containing protein n=1 Tax=Panicum virgatum TaxID=38727 RepID=A0A8T0PRR7_PANVG|nr:RNA-binding protein P-like [Panicum virgatum]KAG2563198.1 hypothetical protein PVAP13_8KG311100 [Panicum virgatum]KAG2563199.1 hypothetical protein PVAP13_8KG311100 [Panicum virgatum]KAG2563200.1 hypothetical protein PVAP13_8KG311100 [Panicum virgatum]
MGKRKKGKATTGPHENPDLAPHSQPTTTSTPERKRRLPRDRSPATGSDSEADPSPPSSPGSVRRLIEPYSRPRLLAILAEAAAADPALRARLGAAADASPSHRRLFVHGLPPRAGDDALAAAFSRFGPLADCHAVADRATGRCRGYGFVSFASRAAARRALRGAPRVAVAGCPVSAQFASAGPGPGPSGGGGAGRRVYVTNVAPDASAERLRAFFARFGELDGGPFGFDADTGSSRGYALFVYREAAGAARAVEEPYRVFEGRTLRCQLANEPARKAKAPPAPPPAVVAASAAVTPPPAPAAAEAPALQLVLDAIAAAGVGDLAKYARDPAQAAVFLGQNPALAAAALSSVLAVAAASRSPAAAPAVAPTPAAASAPAVATGKPAAAAAVEPLPVKFGVGSSGGAGLLGPYKPPLSPVVSLSSSPGKKGTMLGQS